MLIRKEVIAPDVVLGVWQIEPMDGLSARDNERASVRLLLSELLHTDDFCLNHNADGKPFLVCNDVSTNVSISHTKEYVAVMLSSLRLLGVDIEMRGPRILRVKERFMRKEELDSVGIDSSAEDVLQYWCSKEALYKLYSEDHLTFQQMWIEKVGDAFVAWNLVRNEYVEMSIAVDHDFVMAYAYR